MKTMKLMQKSVIPLVFYLSIFSNIGLAVAQTLPVNQLTKKTFTISQKFKPRVDNKRNPSSAGGASRGAVNLSCLTKAEKEQFIPVAPINQETLTLSKKPTFFWNIPNTSGKTIAKNMSFQIVVDGENIYEKILDVPNKSGIISFTLPKDAPELQLNKSYSWYVMLNCYEQETNNNPLIASTIKRIKADSMLEQKLQKTKPRNLSNIYAEAGIWQDGLAAIGEQRCYETNNLIVRMKWRQFLESVGLSQLVNQPLINYCHSHGK